MGLAGGPAWRRLGRAAAAGRCRPRSDDGSRARAEAAYRFAHAIAGDLPGFEAAMRALFAGDLAGFAQTMAAWPEDIRAHALDTGRNGVISMPHIAPSDASAAALDRPSGWTGSSPC
ncbi:MAG: DUF2239 family protein [Paracoccaceae bacterium]